MLCYTVPYSMMCFTMLFTIGVEENVLYTRAIMDNIVLPNRGVNGFEHGALRPRQLRTHKL